MSFIDLATVTIRRRHEMDQRIKVLEKNCDDTVCNIKKIQRMAEICLEQLNCDPSELTRRYLQAMSQLDEYILIISDVNHAIEQIVDPNHEYPVQDTSIISTVPTSLPAEPQNLLDFLSESSPSTSTFCQNMCPAEKPKRQKIPKEAPTLITFSSTSTSEESVPVTKHIETVVSETKETAIEDAHSQTDPVTEPQDPPVLYTRLELPAQPVLDVEQTYTVTIMHSDGLNFWIVIEDTEFCKLVTGMSDYYKNHKLEMSEEMFMNTNYCVYHDKNVSYRALFLDISKKSKTSADIFLVDTGETLTCSIRDLQPLLPTFSNVPPYSRCCHLAGDDILDEDSEELRLQIAQYLSTFVGKTGTIEIDDDSSESLGIVMMLETEEILNELVMKKRLALLADQDSRKLKEPAKKAELYPTLVKGPPEIKYSGVSHAEEPEYDNAVEAVMGYKPRDDIDICAHYRGDDAKGCFKGARCKRRHVLKNPDGWTLDRVPVCARLGKLKLPAPGTWKHVKVTSIGSIDTVHVQFVEENEDVNDSEYADLLNPTTLPELFRQMNSPDNKKAYQPLKMSPAAGELVVAWYPMDQNWYRARILAYSQQDHRVEVMYVDYGNKMFLDDKQIRVLEDRFASLPPQAVECKLAGLEPRSTHLETMERLKEALSKLITEKPLECRIISRNYDTLSIELYDQQGFLVTEQLCAENLIQYLPYQVQEDSNTAVRVEVP